MTLNIQDNPQFNTVGQPERATQNRVVTLFQQELHYRYLGNWEERTNNSNIEETLVSAYLTRKGYSQLQITKAIHKLKTTANNGNDSLYDTNKRVYQQLRYGIQIQAKMGENFETVHLIDWENATTNDFAIAQEVTITGLHTKRPDIVIYVNGIALGVLEIKRSTVTINDAIRQSIGNQQDDFIKQFFTTIQYIFAGNDTEGLRYGTIKTPEQYYLQWKEDTQDNSRDRLDKHLLTMCNKERFLELIHDFILFDNGVKKLSRAHQYFGVKAAQNYIHRYEGGIIWHTQGSGKSVTMVWLAQWVLENKPNARVVILTDRTELDKQIEQVFKYAGEDIYRTQSGKDLMMELARATRRLLCSLIHKFGQKDEGDFERFIKELKSQPPNTIGELFVFVDECHRTQSGRLHRTMKASLPNAVFIGFTGTPLLQKDKRTSLEIFGAYIHTYKFNEGVADGVILDLAYEARDIDQHLTSQKKIDLWFNTKTKGLNDFQKSELKKKWGTMQKVLSCHSRIEKVVTDIILDFSTKPRLSSDRGNAMLVAHSIYEACKYYEEFQKPGNSLHNTCGIVTSYDPHTGDITTENTGASTQTEKEYIYNIYTELLNGKTTAKYEDDVKRTFIREPAHMKLLIVVDKLLTGFDVPCCTYLYIDKSMRDHGLFQAICRVNRLDTEDKQFGYIVDYKDLFKKMADAVAVYTSELAYDTFEKKDTDIMLQTRVTVGKERLDAALEALHILCEPVKAPQDTAAYIHYFCGNPEIENELKTKEAQRTMLYKKTVSLIRAYANISDAMQEAGYTEYETQHIQQELNHFQTLREEIRIASGEKLDLKTYEADMRHLIDSYIQADEPEMISHFGDMSLLDIIVKAGLSDAVNSLPNGIKSNQEAIAETIENNVRQKITQEHAIDPAFFEEMSKLLAEIIKERKAKAIDYAEYLKKIELVAQQVGKGTSNAMPDTLTTAGQRALYNNLNKNEIVATQIDRTVKEVKKDSWRGHAAKENEIKEAIYKQLSMYQETTEPHSVSELPEPYGVQNKVEYIFKIIKEHKEY